MESLGKCVCGSQSYDFISRDVYNRQVRGHEFSLYRCSTCGTVRVAPVPDISLYTAGYTASTAQSGYLPREKPWCAELSREVQLLLSANATLRGLPVLDVGCNGGELVECLQRDGISAEGCDVDPIAVEYGKSKGLNLFLKDLASEPLTRRYGVVILNHTLEHIIPAQDFLRNICAAIAPGGILLIHVPNYDGWIAKLMRHKWGFLAPHEHVWQFSPTTLSNFVDRASESQMKPESIRCRTSLEQAGGGIKGLIKTLVMKSSELVNHSDEIVAVFKKS